MDRDRRYNLRSVVGKSRRIIEDDIAKNLIYYGITKKSKPIPTENLQHLSEEDKEIKIKLEKAIEKEKCVVTSYQKAVDRYIRHVGFTFINRIAALRAMEVRDLITETILRKSEYGGMSLRERSIHEKNHDFTPDQVLEESLKDAFREVTKEVKVLFDLESEYSIIFPSSKSLRDIIRLFSDDVTEDDWMQDDIIGWIYQYYNEDSRKEYKSSGRKIPKADEVHVINQFYTPHWIVRVLVDNTLGRLWLEQQNRCSYLEINENNHTLIEKRLNIPETLDKEKYLNWISSPEGLKVDNFCSYFVPLVKKSPDRKIRPARDIKILDPACGSGHFLIYAFDVLYRIYLEDEPETPEEEIPGLILKNNLFGIDIDLRSVQLAALSLYLKVKSYNPSIKIRNMNLICADSHIAPGKKRKAFLDRFNDEPELQEIFAKTFEDLNNTNEFGSLLKVRKPFESLLDNITQIKFSVKNEDKPLIVPKIRTINEMLQELKEFEHESMENRDMGNLLFATEAEKSVGLLSILTQKYDVILMNPPYGKMPKVTKKYLEKNYPRTKNDLNAAFIELGISLNQNNGFVGMLTSRSFMFLKTFLKLREDLLLNESQPEFLLDTGFGVLDGATVETAATVIRKIGENAKIDKMSSCSFCRVTMFDTNIKEKIFNKSLLTHLEGPNELWFNKQLEDLIKVPFSAYSYWASRTIIELFRKYNSLDKDLANHPEMKKISDVKFGLSSADAKRFYRQFWEVNPDEINQKWVPIPQGGNYRQYYCDIDKVVLWEDGGKEIKNYPKSVVRNEKFYFLPGITWSEKPNPNKKYFASRYLPKGCIITPKGPGIYLKNNINVYGVLAYLCSNLNYYLISLYASEHDWTPAQVASVPIHENLLNYKSIFLKSKEIFNLLQLEDTGNEVSTIFIKPWILQILKDFNPLEEPISNHPFAKQLEFAIDDSFDKVNLIRGSKGHSLTELAEICIFKEKTLQKRIRELKNDIDQEIYNIYEISKEDRILIEEELELRKGELKKKQDKLSEKDLFNLLNEKIKDHIKRLISFYAKITIEEDDDGIIPLDQLYNGVKTKLTNDFCKEKWDTIENEIYDILGESLRDWLSQDYFDYHVTLYKRRPIYWQLTSSRLAKSRTRLPGAFSCFVNYHKIDKDIIPKIIAHHLKNVLDNAEIEKNRLTKDMEKARSEGDKNKISQKSKKYEEALNIVEELKSFKQMLNEIRSPRKDKTKLPKNSKWVQEKIKEVRDEGWNPVIDYGVRVNIEPLKEAQIVPKSADRVK